MDVVLIAAAADNDWLLPGHANGTGAKVVNRMLLVRNSCDKVLRFYRWLYGRRSCAEALGYAGMGGLGQLGADQGKIAQFDACCLVGPEHYWAQLLRVAGGGRPFVALHLFDSRCGRRRVPCGTTEPQAAA